MGQNRKTFGFIVIYFSFVFYQLASCSFCVENESSCRVGQQYNTTSTTLYNYTENQIYLNLEDPANCQGHIYNVTFCYLKPSSDTGISDVTFSLWEPTDALDTYKQVPFSSIKVAYSNPGCSNNAPLLNEGLTQNNDNDAKDIVCRRGCYPSPILVEPEYVLGLETETYNARHSTLIAERTNQAIGLCTATAVSVNLNEDIEFTCSNDSVNLDRTLLLEAAIVPITCNALTPPINGYLNSTGHIAGCIVAYGCNDYYKLNEPVVLECSTLGAWHNVINGKSAEVPSCILTNCSNPGVPQNGKSSSNEVSLINGSSITFECNNEFTLNGSSSTVECLEGKWSSSIPECIENKCHFPGFPENGHLKTRHHRYYINSTVEFVCDSGYRLLNIYPLLCLPNMTWNSSVPDCILISTTTPLPSNTSAGSGSTSDNTLGDSYRFLIVAVVVTMFVILFAVVCVLLVILAGKRSVKVNGNSLDISKSTTSLHDQLLNESDRVYEISPYSTVNMPQEICINANNGMAYFKPQQQSLPVTYAQFSDTSSVRSGPQSPPSTFGRFSPLPVTLVQSPPSTLSHVRLVQSPSNVPVVPSPSNVIRDLEESIKSESPYWSPADAEDELYLQLNTMRVRTIPSKNLRVHEELGGGEFAGVRKGILTIDSEETDVAVKMPKENTAFDQDDKVHFLREAAIMGQFHHANVLKLFGVVVDNPNSIMVVVEYMDKGDLLKHLTELKTQDNRDKLPFQLLNYCRQICLGMTYLSGKGFVHRDLAARNILVSSDGICKIGDFGMSRNLEEESYYLVHEGAVIPVKWTAPEAIRDRKYSTASDVWSYGCVLYEIWSLGCKPFKTATTVNAIKIIKTGQRLTPPPGCPRVIYQLMINTWHPIAKKRPTFNDIMLLLLKNDEDILVIPESVVASNRKAGELGGDLQAGVNMYADLQQIYLNK